MHSASERNLLHVQPAPWLLSHPVVDLRLHCSDKDITPPDIFKNRFYELCHSYSNYYRIYTGGSKSGDRIGAAIVHRNKTKSVRLPNTASSPLKEKYFVIFSNSMSRFHAISGFKIELDLVQRFIKDYSTLSKVVKQ